MSAPVSSSFHMTSMRVMTLRVWPLTDLKRCASSAIMVFHLMPTNTELSLSTVSYEVCTKENNVNTHLQRYQFPCMYAQQRPKDVKRTDVSTSPLNHKRALVSYQR